MNSAIVVFLNDVEKVRKLTQNGIVVNNEMILVSPLSSPDKKVMLCNVPPFISDEAIGKELSRYGRMVSPIKKIPLGCKSPLVKHWVSFRRMVFMVLKEGVGELNVVFKLTVDGFDYNIFVSSDTDIKCFKCGQTGHLARACPERQSDSGVSERPGRDAAEPAGVVPPAAAVRPAAKGPGAAAAPDLTEMLEPPELTEAGTEVQGNRMETPDTTPVQGDGGDVDMVDEPVFKVPNKRKKQGAQVVEDSFLVGLPKLSERVARELDRELSLEELHEALQRMENGRASGIDGLSAEFYKAFWAVIGQDVLDVLRDSIRRGELPLSCRRAVLTLLTKKGDLTHLKNWRPVSLLCTDRKLLSKALASRLTKVMERLIHQDQTYCVPDRSIFDNVYLIRDILDVSRLLGLKTGLIRKRLLTGLSMNICGRPLCSFLRVVGGVEEFKYLGVLFTSEGRMDREIDRRTAAAAVMRSMYRSVVVKKELSRQAKLSIYQSIYVPTLTYGHELWVMTERVRSRIQAAEMSFLRRVAGCSLRDKRVRSSVTREELGVEPLLLHIERGQLRWLGHLFRMPPGRLPGEVFRACPTGKRPRGRPRTRRRDHVFRLAWERLGVPPEELEEVSGEREILYGVQVWMSHVLQFDEQSRKVKDANMQDEDTFEIYDPRNPVNKRRREESKKLLKQKKAKS
ncbi:hypothetical protein QTP86_030724 [Hemibagrus guttatus]|nr:hypothetical protein QTP86_030724 [Hemibagrus guttatus]